jgi:2-keto-4-pentenoate hydratase
MSSDRSETLITNCAARLVEAHDDKRSIPPLRAELADIPTAYAVQRETIRTWTTRGRRKSGRKIGLTSVAVQKQLGVDEPDYGTLFADMIVASGTCLERGRLISPRVEPELAFVLKKDLGGSDVSLQDVMDATDYICPALEICDSRIQNWDISIIDTIADNASCGLIVLGTDRRPAVLDELPAYRVDLLKNGSRVESGEGVACLGNPAEAVAWLARAMTRLGDGLSAGDVIMSGSLTKMVAAEPGDSFAAIFEGFAPVSISFK